MIVIFIIIQPLTIQGRPVLQKRGCIFAERVNECLESYVPFDNFQLKAVCCAVDTKLDFPQSISFECNASAAAAAAKSRQSCPTLCDPIDGSPPGCPIPGILQARTVEWVAIYFSNA